ncbi:hypothetical protein ES695_07940 [Candidatus Atribacteria bacterium 1244-E10-H5-B2]|nr:MAG: hypothetical protein ES695_07940 [Candidatus Atribacteria bacterium 1244-E10-H5-B2]
MKKISEMNISSKMKVKLINKGIQESKRNHIRRLIIDDPDSYLEYRKSRIEYAKKFKKDHPNYDEGWRKKNPKKYDKYNKTNYRKRKKIREGKE